MRNNLSENISARLEVLNLTAREASLKTGRGPDVIRNIMRAADSGKPYNPRADTLGLVAQVLDTTPDWLLKHDGTTELASTSKPEDSTRKPEPQLLGERDLPVFAAVEGGPGEMVISTEAIDLVPRPWFFLHVKDAYAVVVTGESMDPVYEPGDMVLVNPRLPVIKGRDAIFVGGEMHGEFRASIKRYIGATETHWIAKQFNPPTGQSSDLMLNRKDWSRALRVVGKFTG